jgi:hypothetical protein
VIASLRSLIPAQRSCAFVLAWLWIGCGFFQANAVEIWLGGTAGMPDYLDLFKPNTSWNHAAANLRVFKASTQFLGGAPDEVLLRMFGELKRQHISLAWEGLMQTASPECGNGIEGYAGPNTIKTIVDRIRRLNGDLRYVAMDEPLWFGHFSMLPHSCHTSTADLAREIAGKVAVIKDAFPDAQIGDIEGIGTRTPPNWVEELVHWADTYRAAVGEPLAFIHFDVLWGGPWRGQIDQLIPRLRARGIKFGIIYNGNPDDRTNLAWTQHAEERFVTVEENSSLVPDQAILQTWFSYPTHMLPESEPGTMTWLVNRYLTAKTLIVLHSTGSRLHGKLTDEIGHPIANAPVILSAETTGGAGSLALHERSGHVPPKAVSALVALRINTECNCAGMADIEIGTIRYSDDYSGQTTQQAFRELPLARGVATAPARFQSGPGQAIVHNTPTFSVSTGDPFTIQVPMHLTLASIGTGYVALIFLNAEGKELERLRLLLEPIDIPIGTATTDGDGRFSLLTRSDTFRANMGFRAEFAGNALHRAATTATR